MAAANSLLRAHPDLMVGRRTVRYYIQEGILPPPSGAPKYARYRYEHLLRLVLVRLLLIKGFRLEAIRTRVQDLARGGTSRLEAAVRQLLHAVPEGFDPLVCEEPLQLFHLDPVNRRAEAPIAMAPPVEWPEEAPGDWNPPGLFQRISLTERVSLEIAAGGDLRSDLEEAAEALLLFLQNFRDTP